jgi:DNA-directed RNA polymerase subunit RPC12/RpoP
MTDPSTPHSAAPQTDPRCDVSSCPYCGSYRIWLAMASGGRGGVNVHYRCNHCGRLSQTNSERRVRTNG